MFRRRRSNKQQTTTTTTTTEAEAEANEERNNYDSRVKKDSIPFVKKGPDRWEKILFLNVSCI